MAKPHKIKRYNKIYGGRSTLSKLLRTLAAVVVLAGVAYLGWILYDPIASYLSGQMSQAENSGTVLENSTVSEVSGTDLSQSETEAPRVFDINNVKAAYLPADRLQNTADLATQLKKLTQKGINTIVIDAKDTAGMVLYRSNNETVATIGAQAPGYDLAAVVSLANEHGIGVIARVFAFKDPVASLRIKNAAVKYMDTEILWLDNSKEQGGKSWLNPYSEIAQMYIADIALECIGFGCDAIMLDGVQFPTGYSLNLAGYGGQTKSRQQVLGDFVTATEQLVTQKGGVLIYTSSAQAMLGLESGQFESGGIAMAVANMAPVMTPESFVTGIKPDFLTIENPVQQPGETVKAVLGKLQSANAQKVYLPWIQAYTSTAVPEAQNLAYTTQQITEQIRALGELGVPNYILYHPQGIYE